MTRGKYATRADAKDAFKAVTDDRDAQRAAIVRLTAENKAMKEKLTSQREAHEAVKRRLVAQINAGTSDALAAAKRLIEEERERAAQYKRERNYEADKNRNSTRALMAFCQKKFGMSLEDFIAAWSADPAGAKKWHSEIHAVMHAALADRGRA